MMMGGWILMVLLVVGAVVVLVWGTSASGRAFWAGGDQNAKERSALRILEDRFASGEIDHEEFERRRAILTRR
jgi:putative membrane protein